jgi:hypothetical protein
MKEFYEQFYFFHLNWIASFAFAQNTGNYPAKPITSDPFHFHQVV